jgi:LysR family transcriptional regulator, low CO2-responsive transcriptional regulator
MLQTHARRLWRHGTLPQLAAFDAIMRTGSFAQAAQSLHMAQPTVSGHVRKLSDTVGVSLFEPQGRRMVPTAAAHVLHRMSGEVFGALARAEEALTPLRAESGARRHLSVAVGTHATFVASVLARFASHWPQVDVSLHVHNHAELCRRHAAGLDDVVITSVLPAGVAAHADTARALWPHPVVMCVGAAHRLAGRAAACGWNELLEETFLLREPGSAMRQLADDVFARHGRRARQVIELSSNEALRQAVAAGVGVALLSRHALDETDLQGRLRLLQLPGFVPARHWHALRAPHSMADAQVNSFVEMLAQLSPP